MADETDLDILNNCMETMVDRYQAELLPVAANLTARLVRLPSHLMSIVFTDSVFSARPTLVLRKRVYRDGGG